MTQDTYDNLLGDDQPPKKKNTETPPGTLGDYTLIRELGAGGMGTVYEAEQEGLKRRVALKILAPHLSMTTKAIQRFTREGEAAGRQQHPNIVAVYDIGEENGVHYIAQELVPGGRTLRNRLNELKDLPDMPSGHYRSLAKFFIKVGRALQHAHDAGVIHRDIKPANILLTPDGEPKISDFGLALVEDALSLSRTGQLAGTPYYMSPEQAASRRIGIDHRTDVFSLGVTLYEALTFALAFTGDTSQQILEKILLEDPVDPCQLRSRVPPDLSAICLKAMEKKREHRYQSMEEFTDDMQRFLDDEPILAKPPGLVRRTMKVMRRYPKGIWLMVIALIITGIGCWSLIVFVLGVMMTLMMGFGIGVFSH